MRVDTVTAAIVMWGIPWGAFMFWIAVRAATALFGEEKE